MAVSHSAIDQVGCPVLYFLHAPAPSWICLTMCVAADCLASFTEVEELEDSELYMCSNCKRRQKSTKKFWIRRLPNVSRVMGYGRRLRRKTNLVKMTNPTPHEVVSLCFNLGRVRGQVVAF